MVAIEASIGEPATQLQDSTLKDIPALDADNLPTFTFPNVWVPPTNRARLEQLCRYLLRPPLAQDRVRLRADGRILVELKTVWRDGTSHLLFESIELLEKLAALIPRPAINLVVYHGLLAPHARWRSQVVRYARPNPEFTARHVDASPRVRGPSSPPAAR